VTIAPLAPVITEMIDNEYTPIFKGTCWAGATGQSEIQRRSKGLSRRGAK